MQKDDEPCVGFEMCVKILKYSKELLEEYSTSGTGPTGADLCDWISALQNVTLNAVISLPMTTESKIILLETLFEKSKEALLATKDEA